MLPFWHNPKGGIFEKKIFLEVLIGWWFFEFFSAPRGLGQVLTTDLERWEPDLYFGRLNRYHKEKGFGFRDLKEIIAFC